LAGNSSKILHDDDGFMKAETSLSYVHNKGDEQLKLVNVKLRIEGEKRGPLHSSVL
jgi:hypothetical protein